MKKLSLISILVLLLAGGCDIFKQVDQMKAFSKCEFRLKSLVDAKLAGVAVQNIKSINDISMLDVAKITSAYSKGSLPLEFTLNVEVRNPNKQAAAMNKLDWILQIDSKEMLNGTVNQRTDVAPNGGTATLPMKMSVDLKKVVADGQAKDIAGYAFNLSDQTNKPTRVTLKAKPSIMVAGVAMKYPGYFTVSNDFVSQ
ncbi:MAG: hypothetical protein KKA07_04020 [Bacteroidetes bacterium]|nr:hypothetical protein [Bacteroidota bacterium]MBU1718218.1 hypothetical protein [Bacteroidota bacterium]